MHSAMKVGTDALLLASWSHVEDAGRIVDAGTGCGIIALMVGQRAPGAEIVGVELEPNAAAQARANVELSPWADRITVVEESIQSFSAQAGHQSAFDVFLINPPFFHGKPKSPDAARNLARHDDALPLSDLVDAAQRLLRTGGTLHVVWPFDRWDELVGRANDYGFHLVRTATIQGRPDTDVTRVLSEWKLGTKPNADPTEEAIVIELGDRVEGAPQFSKRYKQLLDPFVVNWPL